MQALAADACSLDQLYEAAQRESGPLVVASGGDGQSLSTHLCFQD